MEVKRTSCCGVLELADISTEPTPQAILREARRDIRDITLDWERLRPMIIFTGVVERVTGDHASDREDNYGQALADYIKTHDLGEVVENIPAKRNFSGNTIKMWVWFPNYPNFVAHAL